MCTVPNEGSLSLNKFDSIGVKDFELCYRISRRTRNETLNCFLSLVRRGPDGGWLTENNEGHKYRDTLPLRFYMVRNTVYGFFVSAFTRISLDIK